MATYCMQIHVRKKEEMKSFDTTLMKLTGYRKGKYSFAITMQSLNEWRCYKGVFQVIQEGSMSLCLLKKHKFCVRDCSIKDEQKIFTMKAK